MKEKETNMTETGLVDFLTRVEIEKMKGLRRQAAIGGFFDVAIAAIATALSVKFQQNAFVAVPLDIVGAVFVFFAFLQVAVYNALRKELKNLKRE